MKQIFAAMLLALLVLAAGAGTAARRGYLIKVGAAPTVSTSGIFIAYEKGYFRQQGLDVDVTAFRSSGGPMTPLLAKGELDVGAGNITGGLWNAINKGVAIKLVADKGYVDKRHKYIGLLVRKDLVDSGKYRSFKDLKGYRMAVTSLEGVSQQIVAEKCLHAGGLTMKDVEFLKMPYAEMSTCLAGGKIDATVTLEPFLTKAVLDGIAVRAGQAADVYPNQQSAAIFYSPNFVANHREEAVKFMIAYLEGVRDYEEAFHEGGDRKALVTLLKKHIEAVPDEVWSKVDPVGLNPNGYLDKKSLKRDLKWYVEKGYVDTMPNIDQVVDNTFVDGALKVIGKYRAKRK